MTRSYVPLIGALSLLWGASYLFIKVAGRDVQPATMMLVRIGLAAAVLALVLAARGELGALRRAPLGAYLLGLFNSAIPFTLIAWGERHIDSGLAAVANSCVPIFVALFAIRFRPAERSGGVQAVGVLLGLAGVAVLTGASPGGGWWGVAGTAAVVLASASYGVSSLYGQHLVGHVSGPVLSTTALLGAFVVMLPLGIAQAPHSTFTWQALASIAALAVVGTAFAQLLWFRLLRRYGSARSSLVTYLLPATALVYGSVFLGERITVAELAGFVLILGGVALGSRGVSRMAGDARHPAPRDARRRQLAGRAPERRGDRAVPGRGSRLRR